MTGGFSWGSSQAGEMVVCQPYTRRPLGSALATVAAVAAGWATAVAAAGVLILCGTTGFSGAAAGAGALVGAAGACALPQAARRTRLVELPASARKLRRDRVRVAGLPGSLSLDCMGTPH